MKPGLLKVMSILTLSGFLLIACSSSGYRELATPPSVSESFQMPAAQTDAVISINGGDPIARWWESLEDPQLSALVETALLHNNDIGIAIANVELARSVLEVDSADRLPFIGTSLEMVDQRQADALIVPGIDKNITTYSSAIDASWELDLFGRVSQRINIARAEFEATEATLDNVHVIVAAEVARAYIQLRGTQYRLDVNQRNADAMEQSFQLTQEMMEGGLGDILDVQRSLAQLELVRSRLPALQAQIDILINRLSVLSGKMPGVLQDELSTPAPLPGIPVSVSVGDPVQLLTRRPDIRRIERLLGASLARYELSVAELYPNATLSGSLGFIATSFADLGSGGAFTHLVAPRISWQAFNLGRVRANIDIADAEVQGNLQRFEQAVLTAFEEVDNSLVAISRESDRRVRLFTAADASARATGFARERFESGTDSYFAVLDAQRTQLEAEDQLAVSEMELALQLVGLYKALGGGWQIE